MRLAASHFLNAMTTSSFGGRRTANTSAQSFALRMPRTPGSEGIDRWGDTDVAFSETPALSAGHANRSFTAINARLVARPVSCRKTVPSSWALFSDATSAAIGASPTKVSKTVNSSEPDNQSSFDWGSARNCRAERAEPSPALRTGAPVVPCRVRP